MLTSVFFAYETLRTYLHRKRICLVADLKYQVLGFTESYLSSLVFDQNPSY